MDRYHKQTNRNWHCHEVKCKELFSRLRKMWKKTISARQRERSKKRKKLFIINTHKEHHIMMISKWAHLCIHYMCRPSAVTVSVTMAAAASAAATHQKNYENNNNACVCISIDNCTIIIIAQRSATKLRKYILWIWTYRDNDAASLSLCCEWSRMMLLCVCLWCGKGLWPLGYCPRICLYMYSYFVFRILMQHTASL